MEVFFDKTEASGWSDPYLSTGTIDAGSGVCVNCGRHFEILAECVAEVLTDDRRSRVGLERVQLWRAGDGSARRRVPKWPDIKDVMLH